MLDVDRGFAFNAKAAVPRHRQTIFERFFQPLVYAFDKFLLSPLEFARYVDDFQSPYLKAYFDVGNVVFYGYPQDWIRALGPRIAKVHLKDFHLDRPAGRFAWTNIGDGDIDWLAVRRAFDEIGYRGYCTTEVQGGDAAYLKDLAGRVDRFLAGQKPI